MADIMKYVYHLTDELGVRPGNSEDEYYAATELEKIMKSHGVETIVHEFPLYQMTPLAAGLLMTIMGVCTLLAGLQGVVGIIMTLLAVVAAVLYALELLDKGPISRLTLGGMSQNVIARHRGTAAAPGRRPRPVVIVANYDSPKADLLKSPAIAWTQPLLFMAVKVCMVAVPVLLVLSCIGFLPGILRRILWVLAFIGAIPLLVSGINQLISHFAMGYVQGANDNASGVAALLGVLNRVRPLDQETCLEARRRDEEAARIAAEEGLMDDDNTALYSSASSEDPEQTVVFTQEEIDEAAHVGDMIPGEAAAQSTTHAHNAAEFTQRMKAASQRKMVRRGPGVARAAGVLPPEVKISYVALDPEMGASRAAAPAQAAAAAGKAAGASVAAAKTAGAQGLKSVTTQAQAAVKAVSEAAEEFAGSLRDRSGQGAHDKTASPRNRAGQDGAVVSLAEERNTLRKSEQAQGQSETQAEEAASQQGIDAGAQQVTQVQLRLGEEVAEDMEAERVVTSGRADHSQGAQAAAETAVSAEKGAQNASGARTQAPRKRTVPVQTRSRFADLPIDYKRPGHEDHDEAPAEDDSRVAEELTDQAPAAQTNVADHSVQGEQQEAAEPEAVPTTEAAPAVKAVTPAEPVKESAPVAAPAAQTAAPASAAQTTTPAAAGKTAVESSKKPAESSQSAHDEAEIRAKILAHDDTYEAPTFTFEGEDVEMPTYDAEAAVNAARGSGRITDEKVPFTPAPSKTQSLNLVSLQETRGELGLESHLPQEQQGASSTQTAAAQTAAAQAAAGQQSGVQQGNAQREEVLEDPQWGTTSFRPRMHQSLLDIPDPSISAVDPFSVTDVHPIGDFNPEDFPADQFATGTFQAIEEPQQQDDYELEMPKDNVFRRFGDKLGSIFGGNKSQAEAGNARPSRRSNRQTQQDDDSLSSWLGVDEDFNAKRDGRKIGSWDNFDDDKSWRGGGTRIPSQDEKKQAPTSGDATDTAREASAAHDGETQEIALNPQDRALMRIDTENTELAVTSHERGELAVAHNTADSSDQYRDSNENAAEFDEESAYLSDEQAEERDRREVREAVIAMGDSQLTSHEIWFVATGAGAYGNAGAKSFFEEYKNDLRGAFVINLNCVGAGQLSISTKEGKGTPRNTDRRLANIFKRVGKDFNRPLQAADLTWMDTDATVAMRAGYRAITLMGLEKNVPVGSCWAGDTPEIVDEANIADVIDIVTEVIRRS